MNLVSQLLVNLVGLKVKTKMPLGKKVKVGDIGVVKEATMAGRIVVVEFESDPGVQHRVERLDVDQVIEGVPPLAPKGEFLPMRASDGDTDEL